MKSRKPLPSVVPVEITFRDGHIETRELDLVALSKDEIEGAEVMTYCGETWRKWYVTRSGGFTCDWREADPSDSWSTWDVD